MVTTGGISGEMVRDLMAEAVDAMGVFWRFPMPFNGPVTMLRPIPPWRRGLLAA